MATCDAKHLDGSWNVNRLSGCMSAFKCGAPDDACMAFEPVDQITAPCESLCTELVSAWCPWDGYDHDTCVGWCEGASLPSKLQYGVGTLPAAELAPTLAELADEYCLADKGEVAYDLLRNSLLVGTAGCLGTCDGFGACLGHEPGTVHACKVTCARELFDEPGVKEPLVECADEYESCAKTGAETCCSDLEACVPEGAANVCVRACEQAEKYEEANYTTCMDSCSQATQESSGEFARRYCQASAVNAELYAGCANLSDDLQVPQACFDACDPVDPDAPCNALEGFACPLACTGLMSWIVTTGASVETASCYMNLIGLSCDPGKVYGELESGVCL